MFQRFMHSTVCCISWITELSGSWERADVEKKAGGFRNPEKALWLHRWTTSIKCLIIYKLWLYTNGKSQIAETWHSEYTCFPCTYAETSPGTCGSRFQTESIWCNWTCISFPPDIGAFQGRKSWVGGPVPIPTVSAAPKTVMCVTCER